MERVSSSETMPQDYWYYKGVKNRMTKSFLFPNKDSERALPAPNENGLRRCLSPGSFAVLCCNYTLCANLFRAELKWTRQGETIDWGYGIRPASADFPPAGGVWGGMRAGFGLGGFAAEFRASKTGVSPIKNAIFQKNGPSIFDSMCKKLRQSK